MSGGNQGLNYNRNITVAQAKNGLHRLRDDQMDDKEKVKCPTKTDDAKVTFSPEEKTAEKTDIEVEMTPFLPEEDDDWSDSDDDDTEIEARNSSIIGKIVINAQQICKRSHLFLTRITKGYLVSGLCLVGYIVYFALAMNYEFGSEASHRLLGCTILGVLILLSGYVSKACDWIFRKVYGAEKLSVRHRGYIATVRFFCRWIMYGLLTGIVVWVLVEQGRKNLTNLRSLPGLFIFMVICMFLSTHPSKINWHTVFWSVGLQFLMALAVLKFKFGKDVILWTQARLDEFFANAEEGSKLLFGESYRDHYMIMGALPIVFLSNATLTILYYLGAMQFVIRVVGSFLSFVLGTSPVESMSVAAGIFLEGITAILSMRPYLRLMSKSQLFLVITSVFASLGGAYLAILSSLGVSLEFLVPAMLVSAPATFAVCKLMVPETHIKIGGTMMDHLELGAEEKQKYSNVLDAAQTGATSMLSLVGNVAVVAFAFFSYISWINKTLDWFGQRVGIEELSIEMISSYVLYPVALAMGIEPQDCKNVAMLLGYRIGVTNIIAFFKLTEMKANKARYEEYLSVTNGTGPVTHYNGHIILENWNQTLKHGFINERSEAIATYCLCGFSSFLTVAITIGILYTLLPNRKVWISKVAVACLIAGNIANCMTGCFASIFY